MYFIKYKIDVILLNKIVYTMPVNLDDALKIKEHAVRAMTWKNIGSPEHCKMFGFTNWSHMLDMGFSSPQNYIEFLEGKWARDSHWKAGCLTDWEDCKTKCALGKYHARELCEMILKKYGDRNPSLYEFTPSTTVLIKAKDQMNKVKKAVNDEMQRFNETGEFILGVRDKELENRVKKIESQHLLFREHIDVLEELVVTLAEQVIVKPNEVIEPLEPLETLEPLEPLDEEEEYFRDVFIPAVVVVFIGLILALYYDTRNVEAFLHNNSSYGRRLMA
jgi:hypothetical protein